jgi:hypothetical protein
MFASPEFSMTLLECYATPIITAFPAAAEVVKVKVLLNV